MENILRLEKPDIAIITGDVVSGYAWDEVTHPWAAIHYQKLEKVFEEAGVYFASTGGNHEEDADLNRQEIFDLDRSLKMSLTQENAVPGSKLPFNYVMPIFS